MHKFLRSWFVIYVTLAVPVLATADAITDWNEIALASTITAKQSAFVATRTMAMVHTAMFDAVNSVEAHYAPYKFKESAPAGTSPEAAAIAAAHGVLLALFADQRANLDAAYATSMQRIPEGTGKEGGITLGKKIAAKILALRATDGADAPNDYRPPTTAGLYVVTTLPVAVHWGSVSPWMMERGSQFRPGPPPQLTSPVWASDYNELKSLGGKNSALRTAEQSGIATFWSITGPSSWDPIVRQLANAPGRTLSENARLFALVEMATADAYIAVFDAKYTFNFWRPITAIRNGDIDGNDATSREADWEPLIDTPLHPEYPCAHCITSSAAATVLESEFGTGTVPLMTHVITMTSANAPGVVRKWATIREWTDEVALARIFGGLHYRNSTLVGKAMGRKIGELAVREYLKPTH